MAAMPNQPNLFEEDPARPAATPSPPAAETSSHEQPTNEPRAHELPANPVPRAPTLPAGATSAFGPASP